VTLCPAYGRGANYYGLVVFDHVTMPTAQSGAGVQLNAAGRGLSAARSVLAAVTLMLASGAACAERASASRLTIANDRILYVADPGERNAIHISGGVRTYVVRDTIAAIRVVAPCKLTEASQAGPVQASCPAPGLTGVEVQAGDGDDSVSLANTAATAVLAGGPGDDHLVGGTAADQIDGGEGADLLTGRGGNDRLVGGDGADRLRGGPGDDSVEGGAGDDSIATDLGADNLDGGQGFDAVSYGGRAVPVGVVLDGVANDGQSGEGDNVQPTVERIRGGRADDVLSAPSAGAAPGPGLALEGEAGNDVLIGGFGADDLRGGPGNDQISGGRSPDVLTGGGGSDSIAGGEGDDLVDAADGILDTVDCGEGIDSASLDRSDAGAVGCERDVPGGTPGGVSQSDVPDVFRFSREKLRRRRGQYVVEFNTVVRGWTVRRPQRIRIRVTFLTASGRRVGAPVLREVRTAINARRPTTVRLPRVPRKARKVKVDVDTGTS
jgi:RTX calcium-binding nonapeptide repeat (4 copies)